ncbi:sulfatase-like hydrolase/transferase [Limihaloglobus sulfuriphilus]|nr:sulfatase-like hydrolase/transferase [Limihaloglobus sulfuriphilus]
MTPHLGCWGEEFAITPNIDQFAAEGIRYTRAFTVHGVCAPSRSGIITGMYPSSLGSCNMRCTASKPDSIKCFTEYLRKEGYYCTNRAKEDYNFETPKNAWDVSGENDSAKKGPVSHWRDRPEGKPFFAVFNFMETHESRLWNSADFENTHPEKLNKSQWQDPANMQVPPIYPDTEAVRKDFARLFERITEFDYFVKERLDELKQAGLYEDTIVFIWSDHGNGLPRAKRWLYDSGTLAHIIVRVPEKFKTYDCPKPGSIDDRLINFIDLGPTVLNLAGIKTPEHMQGRAFLGENLPPQRNYIFAARQRIDERHDMIRSVRDRRFRYIRNFMPFQPYFNPVPYAEKCNTMKELRRLHKDGKLNAVQAQWMADRRPFEELYDLENDPWETKNLADDPQYSIRKKRLQTALYNWMVDTRDTGLLPEPEMALETQRCGSEYEIFHSPEGKERVVRLLNIANVSSNPSDSDRPLINNALDSKDASERYWAVLALGEMDKPGKNGIKNLENALNDESTSVRIAAAQSLYFHGREKTAADSLIKELYAKNLQDETVHYAINVLDSYFGDDAKPAIERVKELQDSNPGRYSKRMIEIFLEKFAV